MGLLTPVAIRLGALEWLPRFLPQITWVDRMLSRLTGGRVTLVRIAWVLLAIFPPVPGFLAYIICWIVMEKDPLPVPQESSAPLTSPSNSI